MKLDLRLELRDAPGQLEHVLGVLARFGGNVRSIAHERDAARRGVVPVRIVFDLPDEARDRVMDAIREQWVLLSVGGLDEHRRFAVLLLGHVFQSDLKGITDSVFACGAEVKGVRAEIRRQDEPSAVLIEAVAPSPPLAREAERRLCEAARSRGLTPIQALEEAGA